MAAAAEHWLAQLAHGCIEEPQAAARPRRLQLNFSFDVLELMWAMRRAEQAGQVGQLRPARPPLFVTIPFALLRRMHCDGYWFAPKLDYAYNDTTYHASPLCADICEFSLVHLVVVEVHTAADVAAVMEAAAAKGSFIRRCMCVGNHRSVRTAFSLRQRCYRDAAAIAFFQQRLPGVVFARDDAPTEQHASLACMESDYGSVRVTARRVRRPHTPGHCCAWVRRRAWAAACVQAAARRSPPPTTALEQLLTDRRLCRAAGLRITSFIAGYVLSVL